MTTVSDIITDAYRQSNLIAIGTVPTEAMQTEGFRYLNRLVLSTFGNEVGDILTPIPLGRTDVQRPAGFPWYDNAPPAEWFVPMNTQLVCNLTDTTEVYLHPSPDDGARVSAIDIAENFATNNLTIHGNGRRIDGQTSVTLSTNGQNQTWFYRSDLGEWVTVTPLEDLDQTFPFPVEYDMYFITLLAMTLNPQYGVEMNSQVAAMMTRSATQLKARYQNIIPSPAELGFIRLPIVSRDRQLYNNYGYFYNPNVIFSTGYPW